MRKETILWLEQGKKDLDVAKKNFELNEYYVTAFFCQQSVEKSLKSLYIEKKRESPGTAHSLIFLASEIEVPRVFFDFLKKLTPEFVATRYPDIGEESPYKLYTKERAQDYLSKTEELLKWIESQMKKL